MAIESRPQAGSTPVDPGPFLAKVVSHLDPTYMGCLEVQLMREVGGDFNSDGQLTTVKYLNPFYGVTGSEHVTDTDDYNNTQKSYGMWFVPPDPGTLVVVIFIGGDRRKGYWIGCVQDESMNFMIPGLAATEYVVGDTKTEDSERVPVAEYNKVVNENTQDPTKQLKPQHPITDFLVRQGLIKDDTRGVTTSSARREVPSAVFGISTPGPIDKNGKRGKIGKAEHQVDGAFVSRLGGSTFVMDDGNDKFIRKTPASEGPPEYSNLLNGETEGDNTIPHNECIRFRTRTGHQILLHNSEDLIYIGNARGTAWIELTSDGKIDVYAEDSINIRTKQDLNLYCDRDFNLEVKRNFNTKVHGEMHTNVLEDQILIVEGDQKLHIKSRVDEIIGEQYRLHVKDHAKFFYDKDYTMGILGRVDLKVTKGTSINLGAGEDVKFAPYTKQSHEVELETGDVEGEKDDNVYIKIHQDAKFQYVNSNLNVTVDKDYKLTTKGTANFKTTGNHVETAAQIHMNGPTAATAETPKDARISAKAVPPRVLVQHTLPDIFEQNDAEPGVVDTIMRRMPTPEPYPHHENLDPTLFKPDITDRDAENRYTPPEVSPTETQSIIPDFYKVYSTSSDPFRKLQSD